MEKKDRLYSCEQGFGFYLKLDSYWLERIWENKSLLTKPEEMKILLNQNGDHIHVIGVYAQNNESNLKRHSPEIMKTDFKAMRKAMRDIIVREKPISISWYNPEMTKFHIRRIK